MKTKIFLLLMAFGLLTAVSQPTKLQSGNPMPDSNAKCFTGNSLKAHNGIKTAFHLDAQTTHEVDFVLDFDETIQFADAIGIVNEHEELWSRQDYGVELQKGSNILSVPEGVYDILVFMHDINPILGGKYNKIVIREQVTINRDMQLNFSIDEAKNYIHFELKNPRGESVCTNKVFYDENYNMTILEAGNIIDGHFTTYVTSSDHGPIHGTEARFGTISEGAWVSNGFRSLADIYVNDVSDRFSFYSHQVAWTENEAFNAAYEVVGASGNVTATNNPDHFKLFEEPMIAAGHEDAVLYPIIIKYEFLSDFIKPTFFMETLQPLATGETFKYYLGASVEDSNASGFIPCIISGMSMMNDDYEEMPLLYSMPMTMVNGTITLANNGLGSFINNGEPAFYSDFNELPDDQGQLISMNPFWPTHPVFSYPIERAKGTLGNNCPALVTNPMIFEIPGYRIFDFLYDYIGRYGEERQECRDNSQIDFNLDGTEVYSGTGNPFLLLNELPVGVIDATITNEKVMVDEVPGSNKAQLHFTAGAEDQNPPTMTMMHFKNENGEVTDRFITASDGTMEFSAGDFNFIPTSSTEYIPYFYRAFLRYAPESVEVSYSPYGEDNWNELAVEEVPEYYWPVMGWFYRGSLAGVTGQAEKGWFDLKIRLEDAAGNWQEQVISPAFRIDDLAYTSVAKVGSDNAREVARYSIDGKRVDANHRGVTIIKMSDGTARKVLN